MQIIYIYIIQRNYFLDSINRLLEENTSYVQKCNYNFGSILLFIFSNYKNWNKIK